ncbi:hypothetical protein ACW5WN_01415 [Aeromonas lacus]|uniref:hypothetical protein n=1 Tax=Aeromonas lacus TaxID=558884 RepID=UPI00051B61A4|nr:hypothetical protein [Aeromonas lacus]
MASLQYEKAIVDYTITTGDTFYAKGIVTQREGEELYAVDLTNCQVTGKARLAFNVDGDSFALPLVVHEDQVNNTGVVMLYFSPIQSAQYRPDSRPKKFIYDMQVIDAEGNVYTFQKGTITFENDIDYLNS